MLCYTIFINCVKCFIKKIFSEIFYLRHKFLHIVLSWFLFIIPHIYNPLKHFLTNAYVMHLQWYLSVIRWKVPMPKGKWFFKAMSETISRDKLFGWRCNNTRWEANVYTHQKQQICKKTMYIYEYTMINRFYFWE